MRGFIFLVIFNFIFILGFLLSQSLMKMFYQPISNIQRNNSIKLQIKKNSSNYTIKMVPKQKKHKYNYLFNMSLNCSKYDMMGRTPQSGAKLENRFEFRQWIILPNISCTSYNKPFAMICIFSHWPNFWYRKRVCIHFSIICILN